VHTIYTADAVWAGTAQEHEAVLEPAAL